MAYKDKNKELEYYRKYYLEKKKSKYVPHPRVLQTKEEKLAKRKAYYLANIEKAKQWAKASRERHKEQRKLDNKLWAEKNREYLKEYHRDYNQKWYQENKLSNKERSLKWSKANPEKVKEIKDRFKEAHKEETKNYYKKYEQKLNAKFRTVKHSAAKRNYEFALELANFSEIVSKPCAYCGESEKRIGIDRIDNNLGYTKENSAPCCTTCNMMKKSMSVEDFINHIKKIISHQNN